MIGTDTGGSSCVSQEHNRTCTATEKMQQATTADAGTSTTITSSSNTATTTDTNTSTAATAASAGTPTLQAPSQLSVMDRELKPWGLYDLSGAELPEPLATMQAYFRRFRALRGKGVEGVAHVSLQRSWCAMIVRWNRMLRANTSFVEWLEAREEVVGNYSLRARVCSNARDVDRICYVQVREGCAVCGSLENLSEADWQREVTERPLVAAGAAALVLGRRKVGDSRVLARDLVLVLANNVRDIPEESGAWLPCIIVRWKPKPTHSVTPRGRNPARGRITRTDTGTRRDTRRVLVRNNMIHDPAPQGDLEEAANRAWDAQAEAEVATTQVAQARTELEAARQSNRELLARTRELERHVFGAPQAAAQPRQSVARTARREGRSLYAPVPEGSSSTG
ncbi:hypothetical protein PF005_g21329 [Phytophthora fragariae]|uniref:Uncharacterized protein n=1 Tax=Phytophthora fragariae TaxID=53985 RepID=A0A6A3WKP8_9STRA|nr:hypothetical protein PF005_g21329 [Phytophthora fragariae]